MWDEHRQPSDYKTDPIVRIHPRIIVGAGKQLTFENMKKYDIQYVVNCAFDQFSPEWFRISYPYNYCCIQAYDNENSDITDWYKLFETYMNTYMRENNGTIFVHCQLGMNRSPFLSLMYVCLKFDYDLESTIKTMVINRPCVFMNMEYRKQVVKYIEKHKSNK
jgi:protein-tyrosine phosphatase